MGYVLFEVEVVEGSDDWMMEEEFPAAGEGYLKRVCSLSCPQPPKNCPVSFPYLSQWLLAPFCWF